MELCLSPVITLGMVMQMLAGSRITDENQSLKDDRALLPGVQKFVMMLIRAKRRRMPSVACMAILGSWEQAMPFIMVQLFFAGILVLLLNEFMQKGQLLHSSYV